MSYADESNPYASFGLAAQAPTDVRADFIAKTYMHLAGAIAAFIALEAVLLSLPGVETICGTMVSGYNWLLVMGAFLLCSFVAEKWANSATALSTQYAGLALYVTAEAVIFLPIMYIASRFFPEAIPVAGGITLLVFGGLTAVVFMTRKNFSFLGPALTVAALAAFGTVACSLIFDFSLGIVFMGLMVAMASGYILYDTSNVLHRYQIGQHVAASLALFASVAMLFWYILRIVMALSSRD